MQIKISFRNKCFQNFSVFKIFLRKNGKFRFSKVFVRIFWPSKKRIEKQIKVTPIESQTVALLFNKNHWNKNTSESIVSHVW